MDSGKRMLSQLSKWGISLRRAVFLTTLATTTYIHAAEAPDFQIDVKRISVEGDLPVSQSFIDATLAPFVNRSHTVESLLEASMALEQAIHAEGYTFYRVVLPQQQLGDDGIVALRLVAFSVDSITVEGNEHFDADNIRRSLPGLQAGVSPDSKLMTRQLQVAAYHPLKDVKLTFKKSDSPDQIDAEINVIDEDPQNFAVMLSNTGNTSTGEARLTGSYQHTNLWNLDHIVNLSYTTSPGHADDVKQYGISYSAPLYEYGGWLTGYYVESDVDTGSVGALDISGAGTILGLHYLMALERVGGLEHWLDIGFDDKLFETNILLGGNSLIPDVRSAPISLTYRGKLPWQNNQVGYFLQLAKNTGLGADNESDSYTGNRVNADRSWTAVRYGASIQRVVSDWNLKAALNGQYTNDVLISGEQFGLGGSRSVRGYEEREIGKDVGFTTSLQVLSPQFNNTRLLGFYEYGTGYNQDVQPGDPPKSQSVASIGVGLRWQLEKKAQVSIDFAHALKDGADGQTEAGDNKIHASVVLNF